MKTVMNRFGWPAMLITLVLSGCGAAAPGPLVGVWTFKGRVPEIVDVTFTLKDDRTFTYAENVAPTSIPVGAGPDGCVTTDSYSGTYSEGGSTLTLTFAGGTVNAVFCTDAAKNSAGSPATDADITAFTDEGLILPRTESFSLTSTTLTLTPGLGLGPTAFARAR
jgi:hypothetical protein